MRNFCGTLVALLGFSLWTPLASGLQKNDASKNIKDGPQANRVCTQEGRVNVCRDAIPSQRDELAPTSVTLSGDPKEKGKLLLLLDIPSNILSRLADDPENNRKYHPTTTKKYQPAVPAPSQAGKYIPAPKAERVWRYQPKASFEYQPKRDWNYNRDVYGRLWRQNILHDTRVVELRVESPGVYLLPVGATR